MTPTDQEFVYTLKAWADLNSESDPDIAKDCADIAARLTSLSQLNERMAGDRAENQLIKKAISKIHRTSLYLGDGQEALAKIREIIRVLAQEMAHAAVSARTAIAGLAAPPADSKPVVTDEIARFAASFVSSHPDDMIVPMRTALEAVLPLYAHPPADSLDAAIKELEEKLPEWIDMRVRKSRDFIVWGIDTAESYGKDSFAFEGDGSTPLAAMRAALERIPKQEGE